MYVVYRLIFVPGFQQLNLANPVKFYETYPKPFCGLPMQASLGDSESDPIELVADCPERPAATFSQLLKAGLVVRFNYGDDAVDLVNSAVFESAEILDATLGEERCFAANIHVVNALDYKRSEVVRNADDDVVAIKRYAFHPQRFGGNLFKLPETAGEEIFTFTSAKYPLSALLVPGCEREGLTGLAFEKIWSS